MIATSNALPARVAVLALETQEMEIVGRAQGWSSTKRNTAVVNIEKVLEFIILKFKREDLKLDLAGDLYPVEGAQQH